MNDLRKVLDKFNQEYKNLFGLPVQFTEQSINSKRFDLRLKILKYMYDKKNTKENPISSNELYKKFGVYPTNILDYSFKSPLACNALFQIQEKKLGDKNYFIDLKIAGKYIDFMERLKNAIRGANDES